MPHKASQRPPRLYPIHHATRQRTAEYVDCDDGSHQRPPCGVCDSCLFESAVYRGDHPATLSHEELARL
jgi:hypothetical protein